MSLEPPQVLLAPSGEIKQHGTSLGEGLASALRPHEPERPRVSERAALETKDRNTNEGANALAYFCTKKHKRDTRKGNSPVIGGMGRKHRDQAEVSVRIPRNEVVTFDTQMFFVVGRGKLNLKE